MKAFPLLVLVACCSVATGSAAAAGQAGWYGGVAAGRSKVGLRTGDWDDGTLTNIALENESFAYKVIAGYRFTSYVGGELSYLHFGDTKFSGYEPGTTPSIWQTGDVFGRARAKGMSLTGVLFLPYRDRFALFARGGVFMWDTTMFSRPTLAGGTLALSDEQTLHDDGISLIYGAGVDLRVYRRWHVRAEWEHTTVRFASTMNRGVDFPSLGVTLDF